VLFHRLQARPDESVGLVEAVARHRMAETLHRLGNGIQARQARKVRLMPVSVILEFAQLTQLSANIPRQTAEVRSNFRRFAHSGLSTTIDC
jgi:hypothetical protein